MRGEIIITDLLHEVNSISVGNSNDSARYWPKGIEFQPHENHLVGASVNAKSVLLINTNRRYGLNGNIYTLMSMFRHETFHLQERVRDAEIIAAKQNPKPYKFIDHANVYEQQMSYSEFVLAPEDFQINIISQYALRVFNEFCKEGTKGTSGTISTLELQETLTNFNNGTGQIIGAKLELRKKQFHKPNENVYEITVFFKNKVRQSVQYIKLEDTHY